MKIEKLLTQEEVRKMFKISQSTLERWRISGMPFIKKGRLIRFKEEEIKNWFEQQK